MNDKSIKTIVILGSSLTSWTCALAIAKTFLKTNYRIVVIEDTTVQNELPWFGPQALAFHKEMGIDERELLKKTEATFTLGTQFQNWGVDKYNFFQPFGIHGNTTNFDEFHQYIFKSKLLNKEYIYEDFCLASLAAKSGKFIHPQNDRRSLLSMLSYSLNLEPTKYMEFLRQNGLSKGVEIKKGDVANVNICNKRGILSVELECGEIIEGDFFIDCSGEKGALINQLNSQNYESWSSWLPIDRRLTGSTKVDQKFLVQTTIEGCANGLLRQVNSQNSKLFEFSYCSSELSFQESCTLLKNKFGVLSLTKSKIKPGQRKEHWIKNCLALGSAAADFVSVSVSNISVVQQNILQFLHLFPDDNENEALSREYNRIVGLKYNNVRDYLILHFLNSKDKRCMFWQKDTNFALPDSLWRRIELYKSQGKIAYLDSEFFTQAQWVSMLIGLNIFPDNADYLIESYDYPKLAAHYDKMLLAIQEAVLRLPDNKMYLQSYIK